MDTGTTEHVITVGGRRLGRLRDVEATREQIVAAVRAGGDFVELAVGNRVVGVLITPSTAVSIDREPIAPPLDVLDSDGTPIGVVGGGASALRSAFPAFDDYDL